MANAEQEVETKTEVKSINLELTPTEAFVLSSVLGRIGGNPDNSPRKYTDRINSALVDAGVVSSRFSDGISEDIIKFRRGDKSLYFLNNSKVPDFEIEPQNVDN